MMKEPIKVEIAYWADRALGIYEGQIFNDYKIDEDGDYIVKHNGGEFTLFARQVQLVEEYNKDLELGEMQLGEGREKNYIEETIEKLEEELMLAEGRLEEHHEAVAKAEMLIRDKEWLQSDLEEEVEALSDAIQALRKV